MDLLAYSDDYLTLTEALETDPEVMKELGGPVAPEDIAAVHRMRIDGVAGGDTWWLTIVPEPGGPAVGTIGIWDSEWDGEPIHELGWMVLPEFHGRGIASAALAVLLERARSEPRCTRVHAFPGVTNTASNALCRKFGFTLTEEEREIRFRDRMLHCNHWELDVEE